MQVITADGLREMIAGLKACTAIAVEYETEPKLLKRGRESGEPCPYEAIGKINVISGLIGADYANSCNNQLGRENKNLDFTPHRRSWGELMDNRMLVVHTNKQNETNYYLQIIVKHSDTPIYVWGATEIMKEEIAEYLPKKSNPKTQNALDEKVIVRDIKLSNIRMIRMLGEEYLIDDRPNHLAEILPVVESEKAEVVIETPTPEPVIEETDEERELRVRMSERLIELMEE
jgi:hypothetical protein